MGASYIYNPLLGYFSEAYASKDIHQLTVLLLKASAAIALVGILSAIALLIMGEPLLTLMYGTQVAPYMYLMTPIIICTAVTAYVWFLNDLLVALRHFRGSFIGNTCAFALTIPAAFWFIPLFGMNGVSFAIILAYGASATIMLVCLIWILHKDTKTN